MRSAGVEVSTAMAPWARIVALGTASVVLVWVSQPPGVGSRDALEKTRARPLLESARPVPGDRLWAWIVGVVVAVPGLVGLVIGLGIARLGRPGSGSGRGTGPLDRSRGRVVEHR